MCWNSVFKNIYFGVAHSQQHQLAIAKQISDLIESKKEDIRLLVINNLTKFFKESKNKNHGAIVAPWHEFRKEANSFFLFVMLFTFLFTLAAGSLGLAVFVSLRLKHKAFTEFPGLLTISGAAFVGLIVFLLALAWIVIAHFMVPVMYRRRCRAFEAFKSVVSLLGRYPGEFVLYCLFFIVLAIAVAIVGCVVVCATCCIAAIPYVGTVILLPIFVLLRAFSFCFLRQFGPQYDVWQGTPPPEPPPIIPSPPPIPPPLPA